MQIKILVETQLDECFMKRKVLRCLYPEFRVNMNSGKKASIGHAVSVNMYLKQKIILLAKVLSFNCRYLDKDKLCVITRVNRGYILMK